MTGLRGWAWPDQHLALDALVAFVDGELTPTAYDRATAHVARCPGCAAEAATQRQVRSAIRTATTPGLSPQFLATLRSIPSTAELPAQPDGLSLTEDGQLVTTNPGKQPPLHTDALGASGSATGDVGAADTPTAPPDRPAQSTARRRQGAGAMFSGLMLGALVFVTVPIEDPRTTVTTVPRPFPPRGTNGTHLTPALSERMATLSRLTPAESTSARPYLSVGGHLYAGHRASR